MTSETLTSMSTEDVAILRDIQAQTERTLAEAFADNPKRVALLDFPRHQNAGDSLIWSGEVSYLNRMGIDIAYMADIGRYNQAELERKLPVGPILFHGGGNFGDFWPDFQDERERVVRANPNRRIVCMPQSIHFESAERGAVTDDVFAQHGGVTVLARDQNSLRKGTEAMPNVDVRFCYDAALGNEPMLRTTEPSVDVMAIARLDKESRGPLIGLENRSHKVGDWGLRGRRGVAWTANRVPLALYKRVPAAIQRVLQPLVDGRYEEFIRLNLSSARELVSTGRVLVTDRLHAHVLAVLLGTPNIVTENSYGKIKPLFDEYTGRFSTSHFAATPQEFERAIAQIHSYEAE